MVLDAFYRIECLLFLTLQIYQETVCIPHLKILFIAGGLPLRYVWKILVGEEWEMRELTKQSISFWKREYSLALYRAKTSTCKVFLLSTFLKSTIQNEIL